MKRILQMLLIFNLFSCKQNNTGEPQKKEITYSLDKKVIMGSVYVSTCDNYTVDPPTSYTGLSDPLLYAAPGYHHYQPEAYDRGWRAGYEDAMFYYSYYETPGDTPGCTQPSINLIITNPTGTVYKYTPTNYTLSGDEMISGITIRGGNCGGPWLLKKCLLKNMPETKGLRMQYEFNNTYPGRTDDQKMYDQGRLDGWNIGTTTQPIGISAN